MPDDYPPPYRSKLVECLAVLDKLADDPAVSGMDEWAIERTTGAVADALEVADARHEEREAERVDAEADALVEAMLDAVAEAES